MANKITAIITLRKEVPDNATAEQIVEAVKARLADRPDIKITAHINNHIDTES